MYIYIHIYMYMYIWTIQKRVKTVFLIAMILALSRCDVNSLQCVKVCCSALQYVAVCCAVSVAALSRRDENA